MVRYWAEYVTSFGLTFMIIDKNVIYKGFRVKGNTRRLKDKGTVTMGGYGVVK